MAKTTAIKAAPRTQSSFRCTECGWTTVKWVGRCGECHAWGSVAEVGTQRVRTAPTRPVDAPARPISAVDATRAHARATGVGEFDRVLGGGVVPGSVILVAGEPGIGKSTLLLDVAARVARLGAPVLYLSGEESAAQVRLRAERIGALADTLYLAAETDLGRALGHIEEVEPQLLVVDSVQTFASAEIEGSAGNVAQIREVSAALIAEAKSRNMATLLVGHVTKEGSIAGPRVLEHLVDVVVQFEGDRHSRLRLVRAAKNRFGATDEIGCFDLHDTGIDGLSDPSGLFLGSRDKAQTGTCVSVTLEGRRPLVTEVQALVAEHPRPGTPRRVATGLDFNRVTTVLAVIAKHARIKLDDRDAYLSTVGGIRLTEPAADLAIALAAASSTADATPDSGTVAFGEVGLAGEVRPVTGIQRRLAEAARLGFTRALVPPGTIASGPVPAGITLVEVSGVYEAIRLHCQDEQ